MKVGKLEQSTNRRSHTQKSSIVKQHRTYNLICNQISIVVANSAGKVGGLKLFVLSSDQ